MNEDRYLTDYSAPFRGSPDGLPPDYVRACVDYMRKEDTEIPTSISVNGVTCYPPDADGNVVLTSGNNRITIALTYRSQGLASSIWELFKGCMAAQSASPSQNVSPGYGYAPAKYDANGQITREGMQAERNERALAYATEHMYDRPGQPSGGRTMWDTQPTPFPTFPPRH